MKNDETKTSQRLVLVKSQSTLPADTAITRDFRVNPRLCGDFDDLLELAKHRTHLEKREAKLRKRLVTAMGKAQKALFTHGHVHWVRGQDVLGLNVEAVLEQFPLLADEFPQIQLAPKTLAVRGPGIALDYPEDHPHGYD